MDSKVFGPTKKELKLLDSFVEEPLHKLLKQI
jgi:hypothetical protein